MPSVQVHHCRRCKGLFQKRVSDLCPECLEVESAQLDRLFDILGASKKTGGITLEALAQRANMPEGEVEYLFSSGKLGASAAWLKINCHACGVLVEHAQRRGRFCRECSEEPHKPAGLEAKINPTEAESTKKPPAKTPAGDEGPTSATSVETAGGCGLVRNRVQR